jgi:hypothetical protein
MSVTFVTAFHPVRSGIETYIEMFERYASLNIPIILFLDTNCVLPKEYPNVKVIRSTLDVDWIPMDVELPRQRSESKDSREYLILMLHKMKYMNDALACCETPYIAWIDCGISHVIRNPAVTYQKLVDLQSFSEPLTTILIPGCWGQNSKFVKDSVYWRFCGGFFFGPREAFPRAYERQTLLVKQYLPALAWEVNYWALMDELFSWYSADHDDSMIMNFPYEADESKIPQIYGWNEFDGRMGEHHPLLTKLSKEHKNSIIIDIGTHIGASAYSLSREHSNRVYSFDILHKRPLPKIRNVTYHLDNLMTSEGREKWKDILLQSSFILLDIDPHEGMLEYEFYEWLRDNDYQGFMVCDDIWYFEGMRNNFWYKIPYEHKIDVTEQGHTFSGTGIVRFVPSEWWPVNLDISDWTVVTAYFDLTRMPDASSEILDRPFEHYLQHSTSTLMLHQNMVIFCEPHTYEYIRAKRPESLQSRTKYVVMNFEDFPMCQYRELLNENRRKVPDIDERNTVSYYLLCMARYAMLKQVIAENPFGSTHFLWLNICIERMGIRNVREIPRVFQIHRDKFSTCYIDYQPRENYLENVMRWGKCSMCSGFFTGNAQYMKEFCDRIENKFVECAKLGYGHADEQLFSLVYFDKPDIFEVYYGDYTEMITNYEWVKERCSEPLRLLIQNSYNAKDFATCLPACEKLLESCVRGYGILDANQMRHLLSLRKQLTEPRES